METKKRLFIGLISLCTILFGLAAVLLMYALFHFEQPAARGLLLALGLLLAAFIFFIGVCILSIVLSIVRDKPMKRAGRRLYRAALSLYPLALSAGKLLGVPAKSVQGSFVEVNNRLVHAYRLSVPPEKLVALAPHCLQNSECSQRVTQDVNACLCCGKCDIGELLALCRSMHVHLFIATGGTLARKCVREVRPQAIVAIACERDLSSGIMDILPIPALGVGNRQVEGPCKNTRVDVSEVERALHFFLHSGDEKGVKKQYQAAD